MHLTPAQVDRACGVLIGTAVGDALGVPYEFDSIPVPSAGELPRMLGGGLGGFAPGEWSDDTAMAVAIAYVAATGADLRSDAALDAVAENFLRWFEGNPPDVGNQTRAVLGETRRRLHAGDASAGEVMHDVAAEFAAAHPHSAGNGALMRTAAVVPAHLDDRDALAGAALAISSLTHADPLAVESCVLWCETIRGAVLDGVIELDAGLDLLPATRRDEWAARLDAAAHDEPQSFSPNGFTVTALQAAASAIVQTPTPDDEPSAHLQHALYAAIRIGNDTDTVAAIAGGLLGARWGADAVPAQWRDAVHGWAVGNDPGDAALLERLVRDAVTATES